MPDYALSASVKKVLPDIESDSLEISLEGIYTDRRVVVKHAANHETSTAAELSNGEPKSEVDKESAQSEGAKPVKAINATVKEATPGDVPEIVKEREREVGKLLEPGNPSSVLIRKVTPDIEGKSGRIL